MNLIDATVTKILKPPYEKYGKWWVDVEADAWGSILSTSIMCKTKEDANAVKVGSATMV